jgi:hypothetical protein
MYCQPNGKGFSRKDVIPEMIHALGKVRVCNVLSYSGITRYYLQSRRNVEEEEEVSSFVGFLVEYWDFCVSQLSWFIDTHTHTHINFLVPEIVLPHTDGSLGYRHTGIITIYTYCRKGYAKV